MTTPNSPEPTSVSQGAPAPAPAASGASENVFTVLGDQARSRSRAALWTTAIGGVLNAGLVWWQYPNLSWLAAGFVATAAYGTWGLLDRTIASKHGLSGDTAPREDALPEIRLLVAVLGTGAAIWAVLAFMAAALGTWKL